MLKYIFVLFVSMCVSGCAGSRILVVFPTSDTTQVLLGDSVVKILLDAGHEVTAFAHYFHINVNDDLSQYKQQTKNNTFIDVATCFGIPQITYVSASTSIDTFSNLKQIDIVRNTHSGRERFDVLELVRNPKTSSDVLKLGTNVTYQVLKHPDVQELLSNPDEYYDAVVAQWSHSGLLAPLAAIFDCPLIWYSLEDVSWMTLRLMHFQTNPAYSVGPQSTEIVSGPLTIAEKARRVWDQLYNFVWASYMMEYVEAPLYHQIFQELLKAPGRPLPTYESLVFNGSLLLINSQPLLGQLVPLPPNAKYVGGHHIQESLKPLPRALQVLLDNARNGIVLLNLGAKIHSKDLSGQMSSQLIEMLGQLEQTVIWTTRYKLEDLPRNVHIVNGVPHQSILNHNNTMVMITAGEVVPYTECVYFGVPVIGIPFFSDQFIITSLVADRGCGVTVRFDEDFPSRLKEAIDEILGNYSYSHNAKEASKMFRNSLVPPKRELLYWIEMVVNSAGAIHLRSPAVQLTFAEMLHLDIITAVLLIAWFLTKVVKLLRIHLQDDELEKKNQ